MSALPIPTVLYMIFPITIHWSATQFYRMKYRKTCVTILYLTAKNSLPCVDHYTADCFKISALSCAFHPALHTVFDPPVKKHICEHHTSDYHGYQSPQVICATIVVVIVVLRVCLDSWWSYRGFSRQDLLCRRGMPLPSPSAKDQVKVQSHCKHGLCSTCEYIHHGSDVDSLWCCGIQMNVILFLY
jgi:hypothetical protein